MTKKTFVNPFRPGAGHKPPYLAGREKETDEFRHLLKQDVILENLVLTGLHGVGKTVLLDTFKPLAFAEQWLWVGTDLSEAASLTEERIATRLLADMAAVTSAFVVDKKTVQDMGFRPVTKEVKLTLNYAVLEKIFQRTPGLVSDKLKGILELVWGCVRQKPAKGIIFAYDEAQNLADHVERGEFPLSQMLDVFQSIQKKGIPFMLALVGLPTLFPQLVEAGTFSQRMFHVVFLDKLDEEDSRDAILRPIDKAGCPMPLSAELVQAIIRESGGYPYFIQFICREVYDVALQKPGAAEPLLISIADIKRKLDADFFSGRWARATDRQRALMRVIAQLPHCEDEFTAQEVLAKSKEVLRQPFGRSNISPMLAKLAAAGLGYKNRRGKYSFALPLLGQFIRRQPAK